MQPPTKQGQLQFVVVLCTVSVLGCGSNRRPEPGADRQALTKAQKPSKKRFSARVHLPYEHLGMTTGKRDPVSGLPVRVGCATCHRLIEPKKKNEEATQLQGFHRGIKIVHGDQTCRTCHHAPHFDRFRLSSGRTLNYSEVMQLCGQCHSSQKRDYDRGIHGGMTGHWDLDRGPRDRNHCIDCHNPHRPAIPKLIPAPRARYRRLADDGAKLEGEKH